MWLNLKILWWMCVPPSTNVFVSRIQKVDNETLIALYHSMDKICRHEMMSAFTWQSQLKSVWMQGVLERELVVRGFTLEQ